MDDYFMAAVLSGAHGTDYNPHLYFVNALYGYALLPFYHLFPQIGWYYIGEMFGVFLSFFLISYILIKKLDRSWGCICCCAFLVIMAKHFYVDVQFTQCAALYSVSGMLGILYGVFEKKYVVMVFGSILLFWGTLMRFDAFLMGMPVLAASMLVQIKNCIKRWKVLVSCAIVLVLCIYGAFSFNKFLYETPEYAPYKAIQGPRAAFGDGNNYDKEAVYEDLEEAGLFGEDYVMLTQWKFYDTEIFAADSLRSLLNYTYKYKNEISSLKSPLNVVLSLGDSIGNYTCLIFFVFCIIVLVTNPRGGLYPWLALLITLSLIAYLMFINRHVLRVENGFWLYASVLAIPHFGKLKNISYKVLSAIIPVIFLAFIYSLMQIEFPEKKQDVYDKVFEYINENPDKIFLLSMPQYAAFAQHKLPPYLAEPIGGFKRTICFGYWTPYLPEITTTLKDFGVSNPMKDMVHDNVIVVGDGNFSDYLQRHYYEKVSVDTLKRIGNVKFYKYSVVLTK